MRPLLLACLLVLLPLRGWLGDAMATDLIVRALDGPAVHGPASHGSPGMAHPALADLHPDCATHHAAMPPAAEPQHDTDCLTCTTCQICHSTALTQAVVLADPGAMPADRRPSFSVRFSSAEHAPGFKPPIS